MVLYRVGSSAATNKEGDNDDDNLDKLFQFDDDTRRERASGRSLTGQEGKREEEEVSQLIYSTRSVSDIDDFDQSDTRKTSGGSGSGILIDLERDAAGGNLKQHNSGGSSSRAGGSSIVGPLARVVNFDVMGERRSSGPSLAVRNERGKGGQLVQDESSPYAWLDAMGSAGVDNKAR
jgi:hypothetical protein